jgi:hypothetical protein
MALPLARHGVAAARSPRRTVGAHGGRGRRRIPIGDLARGPGRQFAARIYGILNGTCNCIPTRMEQEKLALPTA